MNAKIQSNQDYLIEFNLSFGNEVRDYMSTIINPIPLTYMAKHYKDINKWVCKRSE